MTGTGERPDRPRAPAMARAGRILLAVLTAISAILVFQNYGLDIFPYRKIAVRPGQIRPLGPNGHFAYFVPFDGANPDVFPNLPSRVRFFEDDDEYLVRLRSLDEIVIVGGARFAHEPGRIVFSSADVDETDPRTNGHRYSIWAPVLYSPTIGVGALLVLGACALAWWASIRRRPADPSGDVPSWRLHLFGASALFLIGIYLNTGSMTPYAITSSPIVATDTGYAYNGDNPAFRATYDFVDGMPAAAWTKYTVLFRRILYPVLAWPFMKALGFEIGGTVASLVFDVAGFVAALVLLRRLLGGRAAVAAGWLLALYPGAAYWAGMPYCYSMIFPVSLLLFIGLLALGEGPPMRRMLALSLAMGVGYLAYDLAILFVPAAFLVLCWRRRPASAVVSCAVQFLPTVGWLLLLTRGFHVALWNGNSVVYKNSVEAVKEMRMGEVMHQLPGLLDHGTDILFGSGFIFLPALFGFAVLANCWGSKIRMRVTESALLIAGLAMFLFLNLPTAHFGDWDMRGDWISRLYQPLFPAMAIFIARWWEALPTGWDRRWIAWAAVLGYSLGNALIVFGPALEDPLKVSRDAFYRFYDHTDFHGAYEVNLHKLGRRPLGFPRVMVGPKPMSHAEVMARIALTVKNDTAELVAIREKVAANESERNKILREYRHVEMMVADARAAVAAEQLAGQAARGEGPAQAAGGHARTAQDFLSAFDRQIMGDHSIDADAAPPAEPTLGSTAELLAAIKRDSARLNTAEREVGEANTRLGTAITELSSLQKRLQDIRDKAAARGRP